MEQFWELFKCHELDDEVEMNNEEMWRLITLKGETHPFASRKVKSTSICNPILRFLNRSATQLIFTRVDSGGVSNTELYIWCGACSTIEVSTLAKWWPTILCTSSKGTAVLSIVEGGTKHILEHIGISTEDLHPDIGKSILTYDVVLSTECWQGFFI